MASGNRRNSTVRIAWLGPVGEGGGGPGLGGMLLDCAISQGFEIDFYTTLTRDQLPERLRGQPNLHVIHIANPWQWGRWYSRRAFMSFLSGTFMRTRAQNQLCRELIRRNRHDPYDCVFMWAYLELFALGRHVGELPPIIVYPGVHAAGELRWHRRESAYARQSENPVMHYAVRAYLTARSIYQRGQLRKPALMLGLSKRFNDLVIQDCGIEPQRTAVLYHPILAAETARETVAHQPADRGDDATRTIKIVFVARISVRKGFEQIVELSHRLAADMRGRVQIDVIGGSTQWSNYTGHLKDLNADTARYLGQLNYEQMMKAYDEADIMVLPSMYEPGGIVVGESLSRGVCMVVSDEVGSAEPVDADVCRKFKAGDVDAFERNVRELIADVRTRGRALRTAAAEEAERHFHPAKIAVELAEHLRRVVATASDESPVVEPELNMAVSR